MNLARLLQAFSAALDLGSPGATAHHQRATLIALEIARAIGLGPDAKDALFYACIIHDIGVSTARERATILTFDAASANHAHVGASRLLESKLLSPYADIVRHHHDRWDGVGSSLGGAEIPLASRIIHLADRVAVFIKDDRPALEQSSAIMEAMRQLSGTLFDPELVECLVGMLDKEALLLDATTSFMSQRVDEQAPRRTIEITVDDLRGVSMVFAEVIDGKSPYTRRHSHNVARVASQLAAMLGFSAREVKLMEVAGLLHDLGKLSIDDGILDKPGQLSRDQFLVMKQHPYFTLRILQMVDGLEQVSEWAALHHERLNGRGYPFHVGADSLSLGARIMAVADVVAALGEDRPYRRAMQEAELRVVFADLVRRQELDAGVTELLMKNLGDVQRTTDRHVQL